MRRFESLQEIVENGFCLSCGMCTTCAPKDMIKMVWADNGQLRPSVSRPLEQSEEERVLAVCPGINVHGPYKQSNEFMHPVWGSLRRVAWAWAVDEHIRHRASTGGLMTAVNKYLLESGRVSFVLQVSGAGAEPGYESIPKFIRDPNDLLAGSQSRYASCAPLTAIREALDIGEPFAVSLKPCDIDGVVNLQMQDERARDLIVFKRAMFCGSSPNVEATINFLKRSGIDPGTETVEVLDWRGDGCPGPLYARTAEGKEANGNYNDIWIDHLWTTQFRCKLCPDSIGLATDIAAADSWPGAVPGEEAPGVNIAVVRTELGAEVFDQCIKRNYLEVKDIDNGADELELAQPHQSLMRRSFMARAAATIVGGGPTPNFVHLGHPEAGAETPEKELAGVFEGALRRVRSGQADERSTTDDWDQIHDHTNNE